MKEIRTPGFLIYNDGGYDRELAKQSVGIGWHGLLDEIFDLKEKLGNPTSIVQVKEKYGGLRVYTAVYFGEDSPYNELEKLITDTERRSFTICEDCGKEGKLRNGGWHRTLCDEHADGRKPITPF